MTNNRIIEAENWQRPSFSEDNNLTQNVAQMLEAIQTHGDAAVDRFSEQFDGHKPRRIPLKSFEDYPLEADLAEAIQLAAWRIERFAQFQKAGLESKAFSDEYGSYEQVVSPIERIAAYIPGGRFPLISTALMTLIPARVAGCPVRVALSPSEHPALLAAAALAGATEFWLIGGVQAIGAVAFGYQTIQPCDLVVGPGNAYVNEAKKLLQGKIKIDGLAGPSELLAICDNKQPIEWLALDALAQAEHDPNACSLIVSDDKAWLETLLAHLKCDQDRQALLNNNQIQLVLAGNKKELIQFSDHYAPEHLMLCHGDIQPDELSHYGSLFVGANSAVALGDYISGPNHTLPTLANARQNGGLNVQTFLRILTRQTISNQGRLVLSQQAATIADAEGLAWHSKSLQRRT